MLESHFPAATDGWGDEAEMSETSAAGEGTQKGENWSIWKRMLVGK